MRFPYLVPRTTVLFDLSGTGGEVQFRFGERFYPVVLHFDAHGGVLTEFTAHVTVSKVDVIHSMLDVSRSLHVLALRPRDYEDFVSFVTRDASI